MSAGALTADRIGSAAHLDPQLRTPARPRVRRAVSIEEQDDQLVIDGIPKRQRFGGALATSLLPRLLPLLDGTRDHGRLAVELDTTEEVVFRVVSLLWASGVVEEGPPAGPAPDVTAGTADLLSRMGDSTGAHATWEESARGLLAARIEVVGDPDVAARLQAEFDAPSPVVVSDGTDLDPATTLVVLVEVAGTPRRTDVVDAAWRRGLPVVRLGLDGDVAQLGPYSEPAATPCLDCLTADAADSTDTADTADATADRAADRAPDGADLDLAVAVLARDLFALVTRSTPAPLPMRWRRLDLRTLSSSDLTGATRPGCPRCSVEVRADGVIGEPSLAVRFEAGVAMPPKAYADAKAHQMHYKPSNLAIQQKFRSWPVAPRVALPAPEVGRLAAAPSDPRTDLTAQDLCLLLTTVAGVQAVTPERVFRWTASGGNIGSVVAHLVVRDCPGVAPGVYAWVAQESALALLSTDVGALPGAAPASLVLTGDYLKVAQKYAAFALRIVLLDSGCAQATLRAVAAHLGVPARTRPRWDDDAIAALLGTDPDTEAVTAVIDLGGPR